jgi:hypothetical protein
MAIKFQCQCGKRLSARDELASKTLKCPACGQNVTVPHKFNSGPVESASPPPAPTQFFPVTPTNRIADVSLPSQLAPSDPVTSENKAQARNKYRSGLLVGGIISASVIAIAYYGFSVLNPNSRSVSGISPNKSAASTGDVSSSVSKRNPKVPDSLAYETLDDEIYPSPELPSDYRKRTVHIRLNRRISEDELRQIALEIKGQKPTRFDSIFISVYLPWQTKDGQRWANADFDPALLVDIVGLKIEEEKFLNTEPVVLPVGSESIGTWLDEQILISSRMTIYRVQDNWFMQKLEPNHAKPSSDQIDLVESTSGRRVFKFPRGKDRYEVGADGTLRVFGYEGKLLATPKPIKPPQGER